VPFTLTQAIAFDQSQGRMRTYDLAQPGEHPDLPYDPLTYDPSQTLDTSSDGYQ